MHPLTILETPLNILHNSPIPQLLLSNLLQWGQRGTDSVGLQIRRRSCQQALLNELYGRRVRPRVSKKKAGGW